MHFYSPCRPGSVTSRLLLTGLVGCGIGLASKAISLNKSHYIRSMTEQSQCRFDRATLITIISKFHLSSSTRPLGETKVDMLAGCCDTGARLHRKSVSCHNKRKCKQM